MVTAMIIVIAGVTSCQKEASASLPTLSSIECKSGDRPAISFTIDSDWHLSSDALWCTFITSSGTLQEMTGHSGKHTVTLKITDENCRGEWSVANITIKAKGKSERLVEVRRAPSELYIELFDTNNAPIEAFEIGYDEYISTRLESNFRYAAIEFPEWVEIAHKGDNGTLEVGNYIVGAPGESTEIMMRIVADGQRERFPLTAEDGYTITLSDHAMKHTIEFPITYAGMGADKLSYKGPTDNYFGWEVSLDGKTFRQTDPADGSTTTFSDYLQYNITAQNNDYGILFFEKILERGVPTYNYIPATDDKDKYGWIEFDKEAMTLRVEEYAGDIPRFGIVMALPRQTYDTLTTSSVDDIFDVDTSSGVDIPCVSDSYAEYILAEFTQMDFTERGAYEGMYAYHSLTILEIFCKPYNDMALMEKYGCEEIFICDFVNPVVGKEPGIIVDPRIENWSTETYDLAIAGAEVWHGDKQLKMSENEYYIGENKDEVLAMQLYGPKGGWNNTNVVILFKVNGEIKKVLVVTPPTL